MPKIVDPDNLTSNTSVFWYTGSLTERTIGVSSSADSAGSLVPPLESGSDSGVTLQCLYSFAKEEWKDGPLSDSLIRTPFPFISITKTQFDLTNNWNFANDSTRYLIRDGGWSVQSASITTEEWLNIRTLGTLGFDTTNTPPDPALSDQVYFVQSGSENHGQTLSLDPRNFQMSGAVNQAIQHYSASRSGVTTTVGYDFRGSTTLYVREYKKIYDDANIQTDLGVTTQEYTQLSVPLQNSTDLKITTTTESDALTNSPWKEVDIYFLSGSGFVDSSSATSPYPAGFVVRDDGATADSAWYISNAGHSDSGPPIAGGGNNWSPYAISSSIGDYEVSGSQVISGSGEYSVFNVIITNGTGSSAKTGSISDVYTSVQYQLRLATDIGGNTDHFPADTFIGKTTRLLLSFVGDTLVTSNGVFVDNQQDADTNSIDFYDVSGSVVRYPFVSTGIITFNDNLTNDISGSFFMFFTNLTPEGGTGSFGSSSAVIVQDDSNFPITGSTSGSTQRSFTFDYDGNAQGSRVPGQDADVTVVAIGFDTAAYVTATSTIERSKANNISLVSSLERNYENPA